MNRKDISGSTRKLSRYLAEPLLRRTIAVALRKHDSVTLERLARLRRYLYPSSERIWGTAVINGDLKLRVNMCEYEGGNLFFGIEFEPLETMVVRKVVKSGDIFLDVGANIGIYSLIASRLVGPSGIVHAFEPASFAYKMLQDNLAINRAANVLAVQSAVSEQGGEVELRINKESGLTSLGETGRGRTVGTEHVSCLSLDEYVAARQITEVNFLKVDVEGYEGHVLILQRKVS